MGYDIVNSYYWIMWVKHCHFYHSWLGNGDHSSHQNGDFPGGWCVYDIVLTTLVEINGEEWRFLERNDDFLIVSHENYHLDFGRKKGWFATSMASSPGVSPQRDSIIVSIPINRPQFPSGAPHPACSHCSHTWMCTPSYRTPVAYLGVGYPSKMSGLFSIS